MPRRLLSLIKRQRFTVRTSFPVRSISKFRFRRIFIGFIQIRFCVFVFIVQRFDGKIVQRRFDRFTHQRRNDTVVDQRLGEFRRFSMSILLRWAGRRINREILLLLSRGPMRDRRCRCAAASIPSVRTQGGVTAIGVRITLMRWIVLVLVIEVLTLRIMRGIARRRVGFVEMRRARRIRADAHQRRNRRRVDVSGR